METLNQNLLILSQVSESFDVSSGCYGLLAYHVPNPVSLKNFRLLLDIKTGFIKNYFKKVILTSVFRVLTIKGEYYCHRIKPILTACLNKSLDDCPHG